MSYGLIGLRRQMEGEAMQGLGDISSEQRQAKRAEDAMDQAENSQKMSGIGTGAAIGMMAGGPMGAVIGAGAGYVLSEIF